MPSTRSPASVPPDGPALSLSGTRLSVTRRTGGVSPGKILSRSVSVSVAGDRTKGNPPLDVALEKSPRSVKNLRRSNSTDLSSSLGSLRPVFSSQEPGWDYLAVSGQDPGRDYLALFDGGSDGRKKLASLSKMSADTTTWNVLNDQPRAPLPPQPGPGGAGSPRTKERRKRREERNEPCFALAATFTANNRSNKAAVGNSVTTILHNNYSEKPLTPKSSNRSPSFNNILKANDEVPPDGGSLTKSQKNFSPQQRREVSEEEAERFVQQVNQAAVAIQRWYRRHRRPAAAIRKDGRDGTAQDGRPPKKDEDRKRIREEKARLARIAAVQELQQSRGRETSPPGTTSTAPPADIKTTNTDSNVKLVSGRTDPSGRTGSPPPSQCSQDQEDGAEEEEERRDGQRKKVRKQRACLAEELQQESSQPAAASGRRKPLKIILSPDSPASPGSRGQTAPTGPADPRRAPDSNRSMAPDGAELGFRAVSPSLSSRRGSQDVLEDQGHGTALHQLLDTLKLLEAEPEPQSYCKEKYWTVPVSVPVLQSVSPQDADSNSLTAHNLERHGRLSLHPAPPDGGALLSEAKLQSIISFLDEMEKSELDRPRSAASGSHREAVFPEEEPGGAEQLAAVMRVKTELEEKKRSVNLLQAALAQQRELTLRQVKETERELDRGYQQQKEQYEATIQRHLAFIDQLISDKKTLSERCGGVLAELQQVDQKYLKKMNQMQEQHETEIKKLKELMCATEKVRREKWIEEKTKKIKEITVKGLEPEIQKLISKHKQELKKLRTLHEAELLQADQRAAQRYVRQSEELRQQLEAEKEEECRRERELAKQRFEKQLQEEELSLQQQRNRLYKDVSDEKNRLAQLAAWQRSELDDLRRQLEENSSLAGRVLREELERTREEQERRHQEEMKALQERLDVERQTWEESYKKKEEAWLLSRERELKDELRRERDKEIERAIWALEEESSRDKEECERAADSRMQRARQQFQDELQELQRSERAAVEKQRELRKQQAQAEEELLRLQAALRHKQQETQDVKEDRDKLAEERRRLADVIRQEFAERLVATEEENRRLKAEGAELRARLRMEVETLSRQKEEELAQVHHRVKSAILKKEEIVSTLRKQHEAAVKRADHLEALWEQQRKQLLEK